MKKKHIAFAYLFLIPVLSFANEGQKIIGSFISFIGQIGFVFFTIVGFIIHWKFDNPRIKITLLAFIVISVAGLLIYLMNGSDYPELLTGMLMVIFPFFLLIVNIGKQLLAKTKHN